MARTPPSGLYYLLDRDVFIVQLSGELNCPFFTAGTRGALDQQGVKRYSSGLSNSKITNHFSSQKLHPPLASGDLFHFYRLDQCMCSFH